MVVGVLGEVVANPVVPEVRQEHAQILLQHMEVHRVQIQNLQVKLATLKLVLVMIFIFCILTRTKTGVLRAQILLVSFELSKSKQETKVD